MILATMMHEDKYALQCDLAETYHIFDMFELPPTKVALFSVGLRDNSRIKLKISNMNCSLETLLMAKAVDYLAYICWSKTKNGVNNINRPISLVNKILGIDRQEENITFSTGKEFDEARKRLIEGGD